MGRIVDIFAWTWNFGRVCPENTSKQQNIADSSEDFFSEDDFNAVLAPFCCYDYSANSSESLKNIATD